MRSQVQFQRLPTDPQDSLPEPSLPLTPNNMRLYRNENFVGREVELREIAMAMKQQRRAVVAAGIGGVGKIQTVIEWIHRYGQYFAGGVFWLDFSHPDAVQLSIAAAGATYGGEGYEPLDLATQVARVVRQWQEPTPTLILFDNCEDVEIARHYLPVESGA